MTAEFIKRKVDRRDELPARIWMLLNAQIIIIIIIIIIDCNWVITRWQWLKDVQGTATQTNITRFRTQVAKCTEVHGAILEHLFEL